MAGVSGYDDEWVTDAWVELVIDCALGEYHIISWYEYGRVGVVSLPDKRPVR